MSKNDFLKQLKQHQPNLFIRSSSKKLLSGKVTVRKILKVIAKNKVESNKLFPKGTMAFWSNINGINESPQRNFDYPLDNVIPRLRTHTRYAYWGCNLEVRQQKYSLNTDLGSVEAYVPFEHFIYGLSLEKINSRPIGVLRNWLSIFFSGVNENSNSETFFLGSTHSPLGDVFDWRNYTNGQRGKFNSLDSHYGKPIGYNKELIHNDLNLLSGITVFLGKSPRFKPIKPFTSFKIIQGPGPRESSFDQRCFYDLGYKRGMNKSEIEDSLEAARKEWLTIKVTDLSASAASVLDHVLWHLDAGHTLIKKDFEMKSVCEYCLSNACDASEIPRSALQLSSKYFSHMDYEKFQSIKTA